MSTSNLKPSKDQLESNLVQYRLGAGTYLSDLEFEVIQIICKAADKAMRSATRTALEQVPEDLKRSLFPTLTAGNAPSPMATQVGEGEAYRISIPISFVGKLLAIMPTRGGLQPENANDYFISSTIVAVLAAYAHEMSHIFAGHIKAQSSIGQETHADYIGGGLLWSWLQDERISALCQIPEGSQSSMCVYGFLHLISVLSDSDHDESLYLPNCLRFAVFSGGAGFYADQSRGRVQGDLVSRAFETMPACPDSVFESPEIRSKHATMTTQLNQSQMMTRLQKVFAEINKEKAAWYASSEHLRPIKKELHRALKRGA